MSKILLVLAAILLLSMTFFHFNGQKKLNQDEIFHRSVNGHTSSPVIIYDYRMTIDSKEERDDAETSEVQSVTISAEAELAALYHEATNKYRVFVNYDDIVMSEVDQETETENIKNQDVTDYEIFYIGYVDADSGEVLDIEAPEGEQDELLTWFTIDLIRNAFPDLRNSMKLSQDEDIVCNDHLGHVKPHFEQRQEGDNIIIEKSYEEEDFTDFKYDMGGPIPDIEFKQTSRLTLDGKLKRSVESYKVRLASDIQFRQDELTLDDDDYDPVDIMGEIVSDVESELEFEEEDDEGHILAEMLDYLSLTDFNEIDLENDGGDLHIFDEDVDDIDEWVIDEIPEEQFALTQGSPVYTKDYDILKKTLLKQTFGLQAKYKNYGDYSTIGGHVMFNNRSIKKLFELKYQHCPGKHRDKDVGKDINMKLFSISYPILAVLKIQVTASLQLKFGYKWFYGGNDAQTGCLIQFKPYFKAGIQATGAAKVWKVAEGGIFASGFVANSYLDFRVEVKNAFNQGSRVLGGSVSLDLVVNPFEYEVGAYYKLIKCSLKKIFRWKPKFRKVCSMGKAHKIVLIKGKIGKSYNKRIFHYKFEKKI